MMIGRILAATSCRINPSILIRVSGLKPGYLPPCKRIISSTSVQLLSTLPDYSARHYHVHTSLFHHPKTLTPTLTVIYRQTSSVSPPPEEEPSGWLKQRWIKFKTIIKAFVTGSKALFSDVKKMRQIQSKHRGRKMVLGRPPRDTDTGQLDFPLTREELFFITKVRMLLENKKKKN